MIVNCKILKMKSSLHKAENIKETGKYFCLTELREFFFDKNYF